MVGRVVRKSSSVGVIGLDHHNGLYYLNIFNGMAPWAPPYLPAPIPAGMAPVPISIHAVAACCDWAPGMEDKSNPDVIAEGAPVVSKNHAAKFTGHIPPGINLLIIPIIGFSSSTWKLAVGSVIAPQGALATTMLGSAGLNIDCSDPCSLPTGAFVSMSSVHLEAKSEDWLVLLVDWGVVAMLELVLSWGLSAAADALKGLVLKRLLKAPLEKFLTGGAKKAAEAAAKEAAEAVAKESAEKLSKEAVEKVAKEAAEEATREAVEKGVEEVLEKVVPIYQAPDFAGDVLTDQLTGHASDKFDEFERKSRKF